MNQCKPCKRCEQIKPFTEYGKLKSAKDGLSIYCKECERLRAQKGRTDPKNQARQKRATLNHRHNNLYRYRSNYHAWQCRKWGNPVFEILDKDLTRLYQSPCLYCGSTNDIQMDHMIAKAAGGAHGIGNLIPLCGEHNQAKHTGTYMEMRIKLEPKRVV